MVGPNLRSELALGNEKASCGVEPTTGRVSLQGFESPSPHHLFLHNSHRAEFLNGDFGLDWNFLKWAIIYTGIQGYFSGKLHG